MFSRGSRREEQFKEAIAASLVQVLCAIKLSEFAGGIVVAVTPAAGGVDVKLGSDNGDLGEVLEEVRREMLEALDTE